MSLGHLGVIWDTRMRRNQIMRLAAVEIYNEMAGYWLWPFGTPDIEKVIDRSMKRVARLISKDYRAPIKVECCGFTIFRCCCRKANPKSDLLNSIVDGMQDRERDMLDNRGAMDYLEGRGDRSTNNLLEDDAYEADQKLQYLENGRYEERSFYSKEEYSRGSRGSRSRRGGGDQQTVYTEDGDTYAKDIGAEAYDRSSPGYGGSGGGGRGDGFSIDDTLTQSEQGWDEASESQYGH